MIFMKFREFKNTIDLYVQYGKYKNMTENLGRQNISFLESYRKVSLFQLMKIFKLNFLYLCIFAFLHVASQYAC